MSESLGFENWFESSISSLFAAIRAFMDSKEGLLFKEVAIISSRVIPKRVELSKSVKKCCFHNYPISILILVV